MRIRTIKPEFFLHEGLHDLEAATQGLPVRLVYIALWCVADREGRLAYRPRALKPQILPYDETGAFPQCIDLLVQHGYLVLYTGPAGEELAYIPTFGKHQSINARESESKLPPPPSAGKNNGAETHASLTRESRVTSPVNHACFDSDSPVEHALRGERKGKEGKGTLIPPSSDGEESITENVLILSPIEEIAKTLPLPMDDPFETAFQQFWEAYPRKISKKDAKKAFKSAQGPKYLETILSSLRSDVKDWEIHEREEQHIPYPATWLNATDWTDFIPLPSENAKKNKGGAEVMAAEPSWDWRRFAPPGAVWLELSPFSRGQILAAKAADDFLNPPSD